ncbi:uncharacterized protein LOC112503994 [Cynara cardunculus var. scolymus]|uniref:uncharacterized protein LOC112503994 n=1 Tax=Cynara cardunculus var. scolymus TaxID=59895 RepID=UPI000D62EB3E|nr:uncharacterized protein LOC112503994 [Cynara cardunculus var. scolymus]
MFLACKPPNFFGERDPAKAICWLKEIELSLQTSKSAEEDKVMFAISRLWSNALYWWEILSSSDPNIMKTMLWEEFVEKYIIQYCPEPVARKLEDDFLRLEQGNMSVRQYTEIFMEQFRFAEAYFATKSNKVRKYIWGLVSNLRKYMIYRHPTTFQVAVDAAEILEQDINRQPQERVGDKRKVETVATDFRRPRFTENLN